MTRLHAVVPDSVPDQLRPSGGNTYDRRLVEGLRSLGWSVAEHLVPGVWPDPDAASRRALEDVAARLPDGDPTLVDGLLASNSPEVLVPLARRLPLAVLVHLPLEGPHERAVLDAAAAVLTTSTWTRDRVLHLHHLDPHRVHVAEPGVDPSPLAPGTPAGGELLCVAAVTPIKGHDLLVAALAALPDLLWSCVCAGPLSPTRASSSASPRRLAEPVSGTGSSSSARSTAPPSTRRMPLPTSSSTPPASRRTEWS